MLNSGMLVAMLASSPAQAVLVDDEKSIVEKIEKICEVYPMGSKIIYDRNLNKFYSCDDDKFSLVASRDFLGGTAYLSQSKEGVVSYSLDSNLVDKIENKRELDLSMRLLFEVSVDEIYDKYNFQTSNDDVYFYPFKYVSR